MRGELFALNNSGNECGIDRVTAFLYFSCVTKTSRAARSAVAWRNERGTMLVKLLKIAAAIALAVVVVGFRPNPNPAKIPSASFCPHPSSPG
jgi:hypothetical protein